jgi:glutamyl-tRNA synthetase
VVVDDAEMAVTHVVRGDDLLESTPRQILLYRAMGLVEFIPQYCHLPLMIGTDGRRLAKRHGDTRLATYRQLGVRPDRLVAMLARGLGVQDVPPSLRPVDLLKTFQLENIPKKPIIFGPEDHAWLLSGDR